ncbi:class I SAM-dependent DNA methyltransferase [Zhongshania aquimaris]|uniref:Class I SAM-dependent methyltransferase n=1 Tax=Zhongshania aquimaris TaxID=2857107 RepID=A0ABS6VT77_9GAMM|nr:class I SAM-dependent methyltransferase [Zhongshania aquimaris]MBW2941509.1 class I SAM-dependent methyltransferase [Zhongshania aquimaris]
MSDNLLYTDLSTYYDIMCADIDYQAQSDTAHRLWQVFGNQGKKHLDLACGTGPHIRHLIDRGYHSSGLDINQPMLDIAQHHCPEAQFSQQDMCDFRVDVPVDFITCFLYSIHYNSSVIKLQECIRHAHKALTTGGVFCFNAVDKNKIDNYSFTSHTVEQDGNQFVFSSRWYYCGSGEQQALKLSIHKTTLNVTEKWQDEHCMVAVSFEELLALLSPYFEVHVFEHDFEKLVPFSGSTGNALFTCVKITA